MSSQAVVVNFVFARFYIKCCYLESAIPKTTMRSMQIIYSDFIGEDVSLMEF